MVRTAVSFRLSAALAAALLCWVVSAAGAGASTQHAAGLVIDTGDRVVTVLVEFPEESISGEELLRRADVDAVFSDYGSMGRAVCSILGVGSSKEDCFREAEDSGRYWNYSRAEEGRWRRSSRGVSATTVEHGDVDGWAWGPSGTQPPYRSFEEIRAEHAPSPSPTPASPSPSPASPTPAQSPSAAPAAPPEEPTTREESTTPAAAATPGSATGAPSPAVTATATPGSASTPSPDTSPGTPTTVPSDAATSPSPAATGGPATGSATGTAAATGGGGVVPVVALTVVVGGLLAAVVWRRRHP